MAFWVWKLPYSLKYYLRETIIIIKFKMTIFSTFIPNYNICFDTIMGTVFSCWKTDMSRINCELLICHLFLAPEKSLYHIIRTQRLFLVCKLHSGKIIMRCSVKTTQSTVTWWIGLFCCSYLVWRLSELCSSAFSTVRLYSEDQNLYCFSINCIYS